MATIQEVVSAYIKLRDQKTAVKTRHSEELAPINSKMYRLESWLLNQLNSSGSESVRTDAGTVYKSVRTSAKVEDWDVVLDYILANNLTHMLEKRVSKAAVEEFVEAQGEAPPGVSINREVCVNIRR